MYGMGLNFHTESFIPGTEPPYNRLMVLLVSKYSFTSTVLMIDYRLMIDYNAIQIPGSSFLKYF